MWDQQKLRLFCTLTKVFEDQSLQVHVNMTQSFKWLCSLLSRRCSVRFPYSCVAKVVFSVVFLQDIPTTVTVWASVIVTVPYSKVWGNSTVISCSEREKERERSNFTVHFSYKNVTKRRINYDLFYKVTFSAQSLSTFGPFEDALNDMQTPSP